MMNGVFHRIVKSFMNSPKNHAMVINPEPTVEKSDVSDLLDPRDQKISELEDYIKKLEDKTEKHEKGKGELEKPTAQCSICLEGFDCDRDRAMTYCYHTYHDVCLTEWLHDHDKCPVCRESVGKYLFYPRLSFHR